MTPPPPRKFKEIFRTTLYDRTQIALKENASCRFEEMEQDLQRAVRLSGLSGDQKIADAAENVDVSWSSDAPKLIRMVEKLGPLDANISSEAFLKPFFTHLSLGGRGVSTLDSDLLKFTNLTFLDVSRNLLESVDCMAPGLRVMRAYNNQIEKISCRPLPSLQFLGLGHNRLGSGIAESIGRRFGGLMSLDLSRNDLVDMEPLATQLQPLKKLRHLALLGNPLCLLPYYRLVVSCFLPQVELLDELPLSEQELTDAGLITPQHITGPESMRLQIRLISVKAARKLLIANRAWMAAKKNAWAAEEESPARESAEGDEEAAAPAGDGEEAAAPAGALDEGRVLLRVELPTGEWVDFDALPLPIVDEEHPQEFELQAATEDFTLGPITRTIPLSESFKAVTELAQSPQEPSDEAPAPPKSAPAPVSTYQMSGRPLTLFKEWLERGMRIHLLFVPGIAPSGEESPGEGEGESPEAPAEEKEPELIGGAVLPLQDLLTPQPQPLTEEARAAEGGPPRPPPPLSSLNTKVRCVPYADYWLDPDVQVPREGVRPKQIADAGGLNLELTLWAEEDPAPAAGDEEAA